MVDPVTRPPFNRAKAEQEISWLGARLREPSTYAGLGAVLAVIGLGADPGVIKNIAMIGTGLGGLVAIWLPETK